jgi:hypothetical protein
LQTNGFCRSLPARTHGHHRWQLRLDPWHDHKPNGREQQSCLWLCDQGRATRNIPQPHCTVPKMMAERLTRLAPGPAPWSTHGGGSSPQVCACPFARNFPKLRKTEAFQKA